MATWGDQTCQRFEATAVGFETGFSLLRVRHSNRYAIMPHDSVYLLLEVLNYQTNQINLLYFDYANCSGFMIVGKLKPAVLKVHSVL